MVGGAFAGGLGQRGVGTLGRNDGIAALGARGGFVVVVTQDRREGLFQVPAEVAGQHPQEHAGTHPVEQPALVTKPSGDH